MLKKPTTAIYLIARPCKSTLLIVIMTFSPPMEEYIFSLEKKKEEEGSRGEKFFS